VATIDELLGNNAAYAREMKHGDLESAPAKKLAVVACMDARIDVHRILGLGPGDAHVIRNAGGIVTEDVLRSLLVSQHALGTREVIVIQHTECGMLTLDEEALKARVERDAKRAPDFPLGAFHDLEESLATSVRHIKSSPYLRPETVRGFLYDVRTGLLNEPGGKP
jgi:carbonic anhydrase